MRTIPFAASRPVGHMTMQEHMLMAGIYEPIHPHRVETLIEQYERELQALLRKRLSAKYPVIVTK